MGKTLVTAWKSPSLGVFVSTFPQGSVEEGVLCFMVTPVLGRACGTTCCNRPPLCDGHVQAHDQSIFLSQNLLHL